MDYCSKEAGFCSFTQPQTWVAAFCPPQKNWPFCACKDEMDWDLRWQQVVTMSVCFNNRDPIKIVAKQVVPEVVPCRTPPKINIESENDGLGDDFSFPGVYSQVPYYIIFWGVDILIVFCASWWISFERSIHETSEQVVEPTPKKQKRWVGMVRRGKMLVSFSSSSFCLKKLYTDRCWNIRDGNDPAGCFEVSWNSG